MMCLENPYLELDLGLSNVLLATAATGNLLRFLDLRPDRLRYPSSQQPQKSVTMRTYIHLR